MPSTRKLFCQPAAKLSLCLKTTSNRSGSHPGPKPGDSPSASRPSKHQKPPNDGRRPQKKCIEMKILVYRTVPDDDLYYGNMTLRARNRNKRHYANRLANPKPGKPLTSSPKVHQLSTLCNLQPPRFPPGRLGTVWDDLGRPMGRVEHSKSLVFTGLGTVGRLKYPKCPPHRERRHPCRQVR